MGLPCYRAGANYAFELTESRSYRRRLAHFCLNQHERFDQCSSSGIVPAPDSRPGISQVPQLRPVIVCGDRRLLASSRRSRSGGALRNRRRLRSRGRN
jgi:hypothetical protein